MSLQLMLPLAQHKLHTTEAQLGMTRSGPHNMFLSQALGLYYVIECAQPPWQVVATLAATMEKMKKLRPNVIQLHGEAAELGLGSSHQKVGMAFCSSSSSGFERGDFERRSTTAEETRDFPFLWSCMETLGRSTHSFDSFTPFVFARRSNGVL